MQSIFHYHNQPVLRGVGSSQGLVVAATVGAGAATEAPHGSLLAVADGTGENGLGPPNAADAEGCVSHASPESTVVVTVGTGFQGSLVAAGAAPAPPAAKSNRCCKKWNTEAVTDFDNMICVIFQMYE